MASNGRPRIIGGAIGNCVHVAGVFQYLQIAAKSGCEVKFLGAAVAPEDFADEIERAHPDIVCVSYRLTPQVLRSVLQRFFSLLEARGLLKERLFYFGGTPECIRVAREFKYFSQFFQGEESISFIEQTLLLGEDEESDPGQSSGGQKSGNRVLAPKRYYPLLRHHFGLPSLRDTIEGIKEIAESRQVDVISIAPDQNAQEFFFRPEKMDPALDGAGGVPIRTEEDLVKIYNAAQRGNYPRLRIYAGTNDLLKWAEMSVRVIDNAWGTIPLFWYSVLDGRSRRPLQEAIRENQEVIRWYAGRDIPVEINDAHHWGLRETSDVMAVVAAYLAAYNAKKLGVKKYIAQFMFNTPRMTWGSMDLAKMLAIIELLNELVDDDFVYLKQVRAGLSHFSIDMDVAKGQLAASAVLALALKPEIVHVVSYSESDHAATAQDVIASCKIVRGVLRNALDGFPDMSRDPGVQARRDYLVAEARKVLTQMVELFQDQSEDPLTDPECLATMVKRGILDAPHLQGNPAALGRMRTAFISGGYDSVDENGQRLAETRRIEHVLDYSEREALKGTVKENQ